MPIVEGPGLGSRGQIGFSEESKWGVPQNEPTHFFDFNSESIVSEFEELMSASIRSDRQVHKTRHGKESAGGDIPAEISPEGVCTLFKHALGKKVTKRKDIAAVLIYSGSDANPVFTVAEDSFTFSTDGSDLVSVTITDGMSQADFIAEINTQAGEEAPAVALAAYAPYGDGSTGYFNKSIATKGTASDTPGSDDYNVAVQTTSGTNLEAVTSKAMIADPDGNDVLFSVINYKYGVYEHTIDGHPKLPQGLTLEIGRDIAAFNYYGSRINTVGFNIEAGVLSTGTFTFMCKGVSTCGKPVANSGNTGTDIPVVSIAYAGSEEEAKIGIDSSGIFTFKEGESEASQVLFQFDMAEDYTDHFGRFWKTSTMAGFLEFLAFYSDKFFIRYKGGVPMDLATSNLDELVEATLSTTAVTTLSTTVLSSYLPAIRGNYKGTDDGVSKQVTVTLDAADQLTFSSSITGVSESSSAQTIEFGVWMDILDGNDQETGFQIMFPEEPESATGFDAADSWTFNTFKLAEASPTYSDTEVLTGSVGSFLLKKDYTGEDFERGAVMSYNISITNNLYGDKYEIGDNQRAKLPEAGRRETTGTLNVEFDNLDNFRMFVNGVSGDFDVTAESDEYVNNSKTKYSMQIRTSNTKYTGAPINVPGNDMIVTDIPFRAMADDDASMPDVRIVFVNSQDYI